MAKNEKKDDKLVQEIADMDVDFAQWYTDVVKKADLADYSGVRGFIVYRPYGYAIWELMQKELDRRLKETGHENVYMPMLIPESLLQKEKDHVEGFAPEVAWVTKGGGEQLAEPLLIRPTSETLFCEHYANIIQSHRDLPKKYNQWCSVVRWEKTSRPFLRGCEFLWQEGHTAHATAEEAQTETLNILNLYVDFCENFLAIPCIKGQKTEKEKFAGAIATYGFENLMHDGKALQSGTSHFFGDGFARAFDIKYTDKNNEQKYVWQTSWGVSTRLIGALIMVHGDNNGLVLPPKVAPTQCVIIPIAAHKPGVLQKAAEIQQELQNAGIRAVIDDSDKSAGWKFAEYEMKGVPIRLEIGPKDIENNQCVLVRRDTRQKIVANLDNLNVEIVSLFAEIHENLFAKALDLLTKKTYTITKDVDELKKTLDETPGFVKAMWCGETACEEEIKEKATATSRCVPFNQEHLSDFCVCCGKPAKKLVYWGRAY